jgi:transcriptional regulator with XRE-family HTH domain
MPWTEAVESRTVLGMDGYDKLNADFGKRVRSLRAKEGYSQEGFAQQAGIDRSYFGRIERGEANPTLRNIAAIAAVFGITVTELFDEIPAVKKKSHN